jgi:hypothetical protein
MPPRTVQRLSGSDVLMPRQGMIAIVGVILSLLVVTAAAQEGRLGRPEPQTQRSEEQTYVSLWDTGVELGGYHNLSAGCEAIVHGFGRNAVWGRWTMPTHAVTLDVVRTSAGADLVFRCRDGSSCMAERDEGERSIAVHRVAFDSVDRADGFARQMLAVAHRCAARNVSEPDAPLSGKTDGSRM